MVVSLATVLTRPDSVFNTGPELLAVLCIFLSSVFRWRCFSVFFPQESISDAKLMLFKCFHRSDFLFLLPHQLFPRVWSVTPSEPPRDGSVEKNARCVNSLPFPLSVRGFFFSFFLSLCHFVLLHVMEIDSNPHKHIWSLFFFRSGTELSTVLQPRSCLDVCCLHVNFCPQPASHLIVLHAIVCASDFLNLLQ